jgi:hypothetical protein
MSQDWIRNYSEMVLDSDRLSILIELGNTEGKMGWYSALKYDNYQDGAQVINSDGAIIADCYDLSLTPEQQFRVALDHLRFKRDGIPFPPLPSSSDKPSAEREWTGDTMRMIGGTPFSCSSCGNPSSQPVCYRCRQANHKPSASVERTTLDRIIFEELTPTTKGQAHAEIGNRFRKKPVVIDAVRLSEFNLEAVEAWCRGAIKGTQLPRENQIIHIQTLEGEMTANVGDWVIRGIKGEFYPCKPDIFAATYEPLPSSLATTPEVEADLG